MNILHNTKLKITCFLNSQWKVIVYSICGFGLCCIDLWRGIGNGAQWSLAVNCTGFCIFLLIVFNFDWKFLMPGYCCSQPWEKRCRYAAYIWMLLFALLCYPSFILIAPGTDYDYQIVSAIANVGLYGLTTIRVYYYIFAEMPNDSSRKSVSKTCMLWFAFIVFAIASINESLWPLWFLLMFGPLFLLSLSPRIINEMIVGITNGIIIGFFVIQGRAFLFRPYDLNFRYRGHYTNPNVNAMFYLYVYIAWLIKLYLNKLNKQYIQQIVSFIFASSMWSFVFLTGSRSAWLAFLGITICYYVVIIRERGMKKILLFTGSGFLMFVTAILLFFPVFYCARYIPALRHHPVWYQGEYQGENVNVMAWDPMDSPKYNDLEEVVPQLFGRFSYIFNSFAREDSATSELCRIMNYSQVSAMSFAGATSIDYHPSDMVELDSPPQYSSDGERIYYYEDGIAPGSDKEHPIFITTQYNSTFLRRLLQLRYYVFRYDLSCIKWLGNENIVIDVWLSKGFEQHHAHNSVLQISYWFGPFSGLFFFCGMIVVFIKSFMAIKQKQTNAEYTDVRFVFSMIAIAGYFLMGLTECIVFPGELGLVLYCFSFIPFSNNTYMNRNHLDSF